MRPQWHFTASHGWLNDPNGLVYHNGIYHLFFQHNPNSLQWSDMHWGHAVSKDLLHWKELDITFTPSSSQHQYFSGCAIIDKDNTAGFGKDAMLVYLTYTNFGECLYYSLDEGKTFTPYAGNPIIRHDGRDPKVFYYAPLKKWMLVVYEAWNYAAFYSSTNLKDWIFESRIHGFFECPNFFEIDGHWILMQANGSYSIGDFDGHEFTPSYVPLSLMSNCYRREDGHCFAEGNCNYAGQMFWGTKEPIMIFWMRDPAHSDPVYSQQMSLPVKLSLVPFQPDVLMLAAEPAVLPPGCFFSMDNVTHPVTFHGKVFQPSEHILFIDDRTCLEAFSDGGRKYFTWTSDFKAPRAIVFGEILYDVNGTKEHLGGAPLNLAARLQALGANCTVISALGKDERGMRARGEITAAGIDLALVPEVDFPTGIAEVTLDENKIPSYSFTDNTSYDNIPCPEKLPECDIFCYGTLAQRSECSRNTLRKLRSMLNCKFFYDVNLRLDFFSRELLAESLRCADIVKMNDEEFDIIGKMFDCKNDPVKLMNTFALELLLITSGKSGSTAYTREQRVKSPAVAYGPVKSTVGAGDAFSAAFIYHYLTDSDLEVCSAAANALAGHVCTGC